MSRWDEGCGVRLSGTPPGCGNDVILLQHFAGTISKDSRGRDKAECSGCGYGRTNRRRRWKSLKATEGLPRAVHEQPGGRRAAVFCTCAARNSREMSPIRRVQSTRQATGGFAGGSGEGVVGGRAVFMCNSLHFRSVPSERQRVDRRHVVGGSQSEPARLSVLTSVAKARDSHAFSLCHSCVDLFSVSLRGTCDAQRTTLLLEAVWLSDGVASAVRSTPSSRASCPPAVPRTARVQVIINVAL